MGLQTHVAWMRFSSTALKREKIRKSLSEELFIIEQLPLLDNEELLAEFVWAAASANNSRRGKMLLRKDISVVVFCLLSERK